MQLLILPMVFVPGNLNFRLTDLPFYVLFLLNMLYNVYIFILQVILSVLGYTVIIHVVPPWLEECVHVNKVIWLTKRTTLHVSVSEINHIIYLVINLRIFAAMELRQQIYDSFRVLGSSTVRLHGAGQIVLEWDI